MKCSLLFYTMAMAVVLAGCSDGDSGDALAVQAPPPVVAGVELNAQPAIAAPPAAAAPLVPAGGSAALPPELAPVQQGLEAFKAQHNRLPNNVEEMVEKKIIAQLPPLPVDKIYFIDHDTGRVMISSGP
jgi:hypothetical protein